jgi:hypothetical protein
MSHKILVGRFEKHIPQGLKPELIFGPFTARLKSCPDTKQAFPAAIGTTSFQTDHYPKFREKSGVTQK